MKSWLLASSRINPRSKGTKMRKAKRRGRNMMASRNLRNPRAKAKPRGIVTVVGHTRGWPARRNPTHGRRRCNPSSRYRSRNPIMGYQGDLVQQGITVVGTIAAQLGLHKALFGQSYQSGIGGALTKAAAGAGVAWAGMKAGLFGRKTADTVRNTSFVVALVGYGTQLSDQIPTPAGGPLLARMSGGRLGRTVVVGPSSTRRFDGGRLGRSIVVAPPTTARLDGARMGGTLAPHGRTASQFGGVLAPHARRASQFS